jgi:hypothetical protein
MAVENWRQPKITWTQTSIDASSWLKVIPEASRRFVAQAIEVEKQKLVYPLNDIKIHSFIKRLQDRIK